MNEELVRHLEMTGLIQLPLIESEKNSGFLGWRSIGYIRLWKEGDDYSPGKLHPSIFPRALETNEDLWVCSFRIGIELIGDKFLILVSPECLVQYVNNQDLRRDILDPVKKYLELVESIESSSGLHYEKLTNDLFKKVLDISMKDFYDNYGTRGGIAFNNSESINKLNQNYATGTGGITTCY